MCDRSMAGWTVTVRTDDISHRQALLILGAEIRAFEQPAAASETSQTVVAQADRPPEEAARVGLQPVKHRLSSAARAFKAHALRAAGLDSCVEASETLWVSDDPDPDRVLGRHLRCLAVDNLVGECPGG